MEKDSRATQIYVLLYKSRNNNNGWLLSTDISNYTQIELKQIPTTLRILVSRGLVNKKKLKNKCYYRANPLEISWGKKLIIKSGAELENDD